MRRTSPALRVTGNHRLFRRVALICLILLHTGRVPAPAMPGSSISGTIPGGLHSDIFRASLSDTLRTLPDSTALPDPRLQPILPDSLSPDSLSPGADPGMAGEEPTLPIPGLPDGGGLSLQPGSASGGGAPPEAVTFQARDSLIFRAGDLREATLFGSANVSQRENELRSGVISLSLSRHEVQARSETPGDTLSYPVLSQAGKELRSSRILFNYETEKGKFDAAEVQIQGGYLIGNQVKNVSRSDVFIEQGRYSTCPPTHMYYYIEAERMKVVEEEEVFFTNARLYLLDIPYPLVFPFGYVPSGIDRRRSGLLEPTYAFQNSSARGIGLQNFGWFQYLNDYFVAQTAFDLYTSGSFFNETRLQYRLTDRFSGSVTLGYSSERGLEPTDIDFMRTRNRLIGLQHSHDLSPFASLNANINLRTADYYLRNSYDIDERAETSSSSSLTYRYRHPDNAYNFTITNRLNQQFATNTTRLSGPQINFSLRQITPFERSTPSADRQRWYETLSLRYSSNFEADYNFRPLDGPDAEINWFEALLNPSLFREATGQERHVQYGFRQQGQISANNLLPSQFLNTSGNFSITEFWYPTTIRREWNPEEQRVEERLVRGFAAAREFNAGINFTTTLYGISQLKVGSLDGFRHTLRPTVGFSYRPDFSSDRFGYYRDVQTDTTGRTQRYSIFQNEVFGGPGQGEQMNLNFGLSNVFETRQVRRDSTGEVRSNVIRLIDNLNFTSSYNFAADSLNFGPVNASLSTRLFDGVNLRATATYSLYSRNEQGAMIDRFIWQDTGKFLQPQSYSISANYSIAGRPGGGVGPINTPVYGPYDPLDQGLFGPVDPRFNRVPLQRFSSPWSASFSFSYRWTWRFRQDASRSATLNVNNISFNLTPKWDVSTRIGYDFIQKELTPSQFSLVRRMVCWTLSFQFNPFGDFQYYFFRLSIDSGQIQSLFQKLPLLNNLERSSSPTGRSPRF